MSDQTRKNAIPALLAGFVLGAASGGIAVGTIAYGSGPSQAEIQFNLDNERTEAFVAGLCNGESPCEGRLKVKTGDGPTKDLRVAMGRVYDSYTGTLTSVPSACTSDRLVMGNSCDFGRERLVRELPSAAIGE